MEYLGPIMQGLTLAALLWYGRSLQTLLEKVAVHDWRLNALEKTKP